MPKIRVLVVDDSVVVRRLVSTVLDDDPDIEVVGTASNGELALAKLAALSPDLVTLDIEMPVMDGLTTLRHIRAANARIPVIMFSTLTERAATATLDALAAGASDYVTKPANQGSVPQSLEAVRNQLVPKVKALCGAALERSRSLAARQGTPAPLRLRTLTPPLRPATTSVPSTRAALGSGGPLRPGSARPVRTRAVSTGFDVVAIGSSTGGPDALAAVLPALGAGLRLPVVIVQHMPALFTRLFAERLDRVCPAPVREAVHGQLVRAGEVLIAPGDYHLRLRRDRDGVRVTLDQAPPENFCRPSVDVMLESVVGAYRARVLAVILTGMGHDGLRGAELVVDAGGTLVAQDQQSSVVWGMPGAVVGAGLTDLVLPLTELAATLPAMAQGRSALTTGRHGPRTTSGAAS